MQQCDVKHNETCKLMRRSNNTISLSYGIRLRNIDTSVEGITRSFTMICHLILMSQEPIVTENTSYAKLIQLKWYYYYYYYYYYYWGGMRWRSWLRHYVTSRKVAGSIPDGIIGIFH